MLITGNFRIFSLFVLIIVFHELGHIIASICYNWEIDKILLLPFGGITIFNKGINRSLKEEFIICVSGSLFQIIFYLIFRSYLDIDNIHYNLLIFNLLPMVPLDGSKILNIALNKLFSYKNSLILTNIISIVTIIILLLINSNNLLLWLIIVFLIFKVINEIKNMKYIFNRFLLERYYKHFKFDKNKQINGYNLSKMFLEYNHLFYIDNKYYTEREIIKKRFD